MTTETFQVIEAPLSFWHALVNLIDAIPNLILLYLVVVLIDVLLGNWRKEDSR